jgi:hypothetical protein
MEIDPLLGPVVVLVAWTLVMMIWMAATRMPALRDAGIDLKTRVGGRGQDLEGVVPPEVQWKAHNYMHLTEQPTIFYAIVFALILMGASLPINVYLAWGYTVLRICHSLVQSTSNIVRYRFSLFLLSSLCLLGLTVHALAWVIHAAL